MPGRTSIDSVVIARAVRAALEAMPDVAEVRSGRFARVGTYGPSTLVDGVAVSRIGGEVTFEIHITASSSAERLPQLAESVRRVTRETALKLGVDSVRQINVVIEDIRDEESSR